MNAKASYAAVGVLVGIVLVYFGFYSGEKKSLKPLDSLELASTFLSFSDLDPEKNQISGDIYLNDYQKDEMVKDFVLYWGNSPNEQSKRLNIVPASDASKQLLYRFPNNSDLTYSHVSLFFSDKEEILPSGLSLKLDDSVKKKEKPASRKPAKFDNVLFGYDSYKLSEKFKKEILNTIKNIDDLKAAKFIVEGHTDDRGSADYNLKLGRKRAKAVQAFMVENGVQEKNIRVVSYGEEEPISSGSGEESWSKNRRVEVKVL